MQFTTPNLWNNLNHYIQTHLSSPWRTMHKEASNMSSGLRVSESFSSGMSAPEVSEARMRHGPHKIQVQPIIIWKPWAFSSATNDFCLAQAFPLSFCLKSLPPEFPGVSTSLKIMSWGDMISKSQQLMMPRRLSSWILWFRALTVNFH